MTFHPGSSSISISSSLTSSSSCASASFFGFVLKRKASILPSPRLAPAGLSFSTLFFPPAFHLPPLASPTSTSFMTRGTHPSAGFFLLRRTPNSIASGLFGTGVLSIEAMLRDFRAARRRDLISGKGVSGVTERRTVCLWFLRRRVMCSGVGRAARSFSEAIA